MNLLLFYTKQRRSQWPRGLRGWSGVGLGLLASSDCWFESSRRHGCLSVMSGVCCQVEVSASGRSPVQRSPNESGVSECDGEPSIMRRPWSTRGCCVMRWWGGEVTHTHSTWTQGFIENRLLNKHANGHSENISLC
jgi:hypothetical protein